MGTTELAIPKIVEILSPEGEYEKERISLRREYAEILAASKEIGKIETAEQAEAATKVGRLLQVATAETTKFFTEIKRKIDAIKRPILDAEKADCNPYEIEKSRLGALMTHYQMAERRRREEEERMAREAAQKQAEEEAQQRALELLASGEFEASEAVLEEPVVAAPVVIPSAAPKPTGSVARKNYAVRVTDPQALVKAAAEGKVLLAAVPPDLAWLNAKARNEKEAFHVPGVELVITESTSFRS